MNIISWHPVLTDHQSYTLAALKRTADCNLTVYVTEIELSDRKDQGWVNHHANSLHPKLIPQNGWLNYVIKQLKDNRDSVHIFSSPFEKTRIIIILMLALGMRQKIYLISEPYSPISTGYQSDKNKLKNWIKSLLRPVLYHFYGQLISRRIAGVFAISTLAELQYKNIGIPKKKIFPFGYFVPRAKCIDNQMKVLNFKKKTLSLIFIGTLIKRKGLDVLIEALKGVNKNEILATLDVYGSGDSNQFDFDGVNVKYCGVIPFGKAQEYIENYDLLVLPSRYDGWGVVVNESLMTGVPVICSNKVGARVIIEKLNCGIVFKSEDVLDLKQKLIEIIDIPEQLLKMRQAAQVACAYIDPEVSGQFMFDVICNDSSELTSVNTSHFLGRYLKP